MKGFTTLISVIVIGAIGVTIVTSILLLGTASTRTGTALEQSQQAKQLVNACGESALQALHDDFNYVGSSGFSLGEGSCSYSVTAGAGESRTVNVSATVGSVTRKARIDISQLTGSIVAAWKETQ